ncbi:unnamed protein product [Effrenium voratum]|nr:unnamed protein product [Effrenium voratum]
MALEGVASPARQGAKAQLLQTVLKQGGAKSAAALRRWAREGRPYRGLVFTLEEVEAAIAAEVKPELTAAKPAPSTQPSAPEPEGVRAAQAEDGKGATAGLTATLRCEPWPPDFLPTSVAAALRVVGDAGVGHSTITSSTCTDLLKSLYEGPKGARYPDLVLAVGPAVRIGAHKAILSGWSNFFQAKFASAFGDAGEAVLDLTSQSPDVVRAMVELMYLGRCEVLPAHLPELVVLADFWQAPLLAEAARKYWHMLPIVHQLEVLSNLDENSAVPQAMVGALVDSLSGSFNNATQHLQRGTASACWRLLGELHTWLQHTPSVPLGNLRGWLSLEEDELSIAVERFVLAAIKAADELTKQQLLSRRSLKTWLPEPMLRRIVQQLATLGAFNEGQVAFWVSWTLSGGLSCEMLLDLYEDLERKVDLQAFDGEVLQVGAVSRAFRLKNVDNQFQCPVKTFTSIDTSLLFSDSEEVRVSPQAFSLMRKLSDMLGPVGATQGAYGAGGGAMHIFYFGTTEGVDLDGPLGPVVQHVMRQTHRDGVAGRNWGWRSTVDPCHQLLFARADSKVMGRDVLRCFQEVLSGAESVRALAGVSFPPHSQREHSCLSLPPKVLYVFPALSMMHDGNCPTDCPRDASVLVDTFGETVTFDGDIYECPCYALFQLDTGLQPAFGLALAEESLLNPSAGFWERHWHRGDNFGWVMRHAARVLGEAALRGRPVPPLPASCAAAALEAAFARAKPLALRVAGPEAVAGTYQAEAGAFRRRGEGPVLELRRTDRTFGGPTATVSRFDVVWKGLPVADYKKATSLWSIEDIHAVESEEMQPPLALLLTRSAPWERMVLRWWYGGEVFRPEPGLRVQVEAISEAEASCLKSSLGPWTAAFLRQVAEASDVLAVQNLCRAVQAEKAPAPVSSPLKPASSAAPPAPPEVCCDEWQKAAEIVRGAAKQLCQLLQDLQGDLSPAEAKHLLARKRRLESEDTFVAAVRRLEKPTAKDDLGDG